MSNVFLDPNYDPVSTYPQIESLLLLFDKVFLYAPNGTAIKAAGRKSQQIPVSPDRIVKLAAKKFVVPVASPNKYLDKAWRTEQARLYKKTEPELSTFYQWTSFDEKISELAHYEENFYKSAQWAGNLSNYDPAELNKIFSEVSVLRKKRALPDEFYRKTYEKKSDKEICSILLHHLGADIGLLDSLRASNIIVSEKQSSLYKFYDYISNKSPYLTKKLLFNKTDEDFKLFKDDFNIAKEFADRIAKGYDILDILDEYKQSNFHRVFRRFVADGIQELYDRGYNQESLTEGLISIFNEHAEKLKAYGQYGGIAASTAAYFALFENSVTEQLLKNMATRRLFIKIIGYIVSTILGQRYLDKPASKLATRVTQAQDSWIVLIINNAKVRTIKT